MRPNILEFEKKFVEDNKLDYEYFREKFVTLPCMCEEGKCPGLAIVSLEYFKVQKHLRENWKLDN